MDLGSLSASVLTFAFLLHLRYGPLVGFCGGSDSKKSTCNVGDLGWEDPLEKGTATHSSILAETPMDRIVYGVTKSWT